MKYILCIVQLLAAQALADEKPTQKDFSKYEKIDTSQFVDVTRAPSGNRNWFPGGYAGCRDREGRLINVSNPFYDRLCGGNSK